MVIDVDYSMIDFSSIEYRLTEIARAEYMEMQDKRSETSKKITYEHEDVQSINVSVKCESGILSVHVNASEKLMNDEMFNSNVNQKIQTLAPDMVHEMIVPQIEPQIQDQLKEYIAQEIGGTFS